MAQAAKVAEGLYLLPRRAYRHQMFGERHNRMCCEGWCPLAAVSVQDMLPHRPLLRTFAQVFRVRDVASFDVGQLFKPPKSTQDQAPTKASAVKVGFPRRSEPQDTLPRRPHASNSCSTGHSAHSRLLGVIIPQAQEFAISDSVYRGLVGVLIRGPCLEQSASLQLCVWYTFCR